MKILFNSRGVGNHGLLLVSFLILIIATFFSDFTTYSNYVIYPIWALWLVYIATQKGILPEGRSTFVKISLFLLAIICGYFVIGYSSMLTGELFGIINWLLAGVVSVYLLESFSSRELSVVYKVVTIALVFLVILMIGEGRNIMVLNDQEEAASVGNAWYGSLYMLLTGLSLIVFLHVRYLFPRIIAVLFFVLTVYLNIFILQRGINVVFTIAEISLILVFLVKRKSLVILLSSILVVFIIFFLSSSNLIAFFDWLAIVSPSERLAFRFNEISAALTYDDLVSTGGSFASRNNLIGVSFKTFTSSLVHFFFGAGEHTENNMIIGHHSFFIDMLASYGIIGGILVWIYFKKQYDIIMSYVDKNKNWALYMQCAVVFAFYILRNFYGALSTCFSNLIILVYFPLTFTIIQMYSNKTKIHIL